MEANVDPDAQNNIVSAIAWSPDETQIAIATYDYLGRGLWGNVVVRTLNVTTKHVEKITLQNTQELAPIIDSLAWHPVTQELFVGNQLGEVKRYQVGTNDLLATYHHNGTSAKAMSINRIGTRIAIVGSGLSVHDVELRRIVGSVEIKNASTQRVASEWIGWSPNGIKLALVGWDGVARIWDAATLQQIQALDSQTSRRMWSGAWNSDGTKLATGETGGAIRIWDVNTGQQLRTIESTHLNVVQLAWRLHSNQLASIGGSTIAHVWDTDTGLIVDTHEMSALIGAIAWSPDGTRLALGINGGSPDSLVQIVEPPLT